MNKKILWLLAIITLSCYFVFWHLYVRPFDFSDPFEAIGFISTFFTAILLSSTLALLTAFIPFRKNSYKTKLSFSFPASIIVICLVFGCAFYASGPHYPMIASAPATACVSVKNGTFEAPGFTFERNGSVQIQTNNKTKDQEELGVRWINDCEYELSSLTKMFKVKIVSVDQSGYECYYLKNGKTSKKIKMKRVK